MFFLSYSSVPKFFRKRWAWRNLFKSIKTMASFFRWDPVNLLPPSLTIRYGLMYPNFFIWIVYGRFWWWTSKKCFIHSLANLFLDSDLLLWLDQFSRLHFLVFLMLLPLSSVNTFPQEYRMLLHTVFDTVRIWLVV